jgi:hypothetical protein
MADTVTTIRLSARARDAIFSATRWISSGELSELPPYFCTIKDWDMALSRKRTQYSTGTRIAAKFPCGPVFGSHKILAGEWDGC